MKLFRILFAGGLTVGLCALAVVADSTAPVGTKMATAAEKFLATLPPELKKKAQYDADSEERTNWNFVPMQDENRKPTRGGVGVFEMNEKQREAAMALLKAGTSDHGYAQATTVMSLEGILNELEKGRGNVRDPQWYFVSVFGTPGKTGSWGWRVEGHHLSINFQIKDGEVVGTTPSFFGSNPAEIKTGPNKGDRALAKVEDLAFRLIKSLDDKQKAKAHREEHFEEVSQTPKAKVGKPEGVTFGEMTEKQQAVLKQLMKAYTDRMPKPVGNAELARATEAGMAKIRFAYSGDGTLEKPHTYRVHGPTFVIEFLNVQKDPLGNAANHVHSVWRRLPQDF